MASELHTVEELQSELAALLINKALITMAHWRTKITQLRERGKREQKN